VPSEPTSLPASLEEIPRERLPRHIAVIMDGNGRWAQQQGLPRIEGHRRGAKSVRRTTEECARLGIEQLTLYCFSSENWKRPSQELRFLMQLLEQYMIEERAEIMRQNLQVAIIGRRSGLPESVLKEMDRTVELSRTNTGMRICLAINYGGRGEIADAVKHIAEEVRAGRLAPEEIDEGTIDRHLYTAGMPEPDLLIRTAGEKRISNFLLWQISYAEIWVTERCWPDFDEELLRSALRDYAARDRRFGGLGQ
jgi:undecaprenyl diphosphate synthase